MLSLTRFRLLQRQWSSSRPSRRPPPTPPTTCRSPRRAPSPSSSRTSRSQTARVPRLRVSRPSKVVAFPPRPGPCPALRPLHLPPFPPFTFDPGDYISFFDYSYSFVSNAEGRRLSTVNLEGRRTVAPPILLPFLLLSDLPQRTTRRPSRSAARSTGGPSHLPLFQLPPVPILLPVKLSSSLLPLFPLLLPQRSWFRQAPQPRPLRDSLQHEICP